MYHSVDRLIGTRQRMASVQMQLNTCYRSLVTQIINGELEPEDIHFVRNSLWMDVHNQELCVLLCKLDKALDGLDCEVSDDDETTLS